MMDKTTILGIGGAGCKMAQYCKLNASSELLKNTVFLFADTDIDNIARMNKEGLQTLSLCHNSSNNPFTIFSGIKNLVILAGFGGKTGSHFTELAAKAAQSMGVKNLSIFATLPFMFEGNEKVSKAADVLKHLSSFTIRTLNNEDLITIYPDLNFINAFELSDMEVLKAIERMKK